MLRLGALAGAALLLLSLAGSGMASAAAPEGPRLAFVKWGPGAYSISLETVDPTGLNRQALVRGFRRVRPVPFPFETPTWSPDGSVIAFAGLTGHLYDDGSKIFVVGVEGGAPWPIPNTEGGRAPVLSPDGRTVVFARVRERERVVRKPGEIREVSKHSVSIWSVGLDGSSPRQLTPWRFGVKYSPSSFSPDGSVLAATRILNRGPPAVVGLRLDGSGSRLIIRNAVGGVFSPDGTQIAYLRQGREYRERGDDGGVTTARTTDLFVKRVDGSGQTRLTRTPREMELGSSWDPSGERIAFVQLGTASSLFETFGFGGTITQINADGSCRTKTLSFRQAAIFGPVWQPGPGREAGRIQC